MSIALIIERLSTALLANVRAFCKYCPKGATYKKNGAQGRK
jgi:hypothetical protein